MSAWIEIEIAAVAEVAGQVALYMSAWIEIVFTDRLFNEKYKSHST
ncbi:MAG: hypothetical protein ACTID1_08250 [Pseudolactococcus laudensis]